MQYRFNSCIILEKSAGVDGVKKEKKPVHKRWWFWVIGIIVVVSWIINSADEEQTNEQTQEINIKQEEQTDEPKEEKEESKQEKTKEKVIELGEEIPFVDFTAKIQRIKINDNTLTIVLDWTNQSEYEQAHFSLLAGIDVYQDEETLEMTKGEERLLKRIPKNQFDVVDLEYKLKDNETPVRVRIIPTNEYDEPKETTIEIN